MKTRIIIAPDVPVEKSEHISYDWKILDMKIAEEMAYIEKPYRENELSFLKRIITTKAKKILIWEKLAEKHVSETYWITKFTFSENDIAVIEYNKERAEIIARKQEEKRKRVE